MTKLQFARLARPVVILSVPGLILFALVLDNMWAVGAWLAVQWTVVFFTRCPECGTSIYFNQQNPYETLLAEPHARCVKCGHDFA